MTKTNLIFFKINHITALTKVILETYKRKESYRAEHIQELPTLVKSVNEHKNAILIFELTNKKDFQLAASLLKRYRGLIDNGTFKPVCILRVNNKKVEKALVKLGCSDHLAEDITSKTFSYKIDFWNKSIQKHLEIESSRDLSDKQESKESSNYSNQNLENKESKELFIATKALDFKSDLWLLQSKSDHKKILRRWLIKLIGPSSYVGVWESCSGKSDLWRLTLDVSDNFEELIGEEGNWFFFGDKPEFDWKEKKWSFSSDAPHLFFKSIAGEVSSRFKYNNGSVEFCENSKHALDKKNVIVKTFDREFVFKNDGSADSTEQSLKDKKDKTKNRDYHASHEDDAELGQMRGKGSTDKLSNGPLKGKIGPKGESETDQSHKSNYMDEAEAAPMSGKGSTDTIDSSPMSGKNSNHDTETGPLSGKSSTDNIDTSPLQGKNGADEAQSGPLSGKGATDKLNNDPLSGQGSSHDAAAGPMSGKSSTDSLDTSPHRGKSSGDDTGAGPLSGKNSTDKMKSAPFVGQNSSQEENTGGLEGKSSTDQIDGQLKGKGSTDEITSGPLKGKSKTNDLENYKPLEGKVKKKKGVYEDDEDHHSQNQSNSAPLSGASSTDEISSAPLSGKVSPSHSEQENTGESNHKKKHPLDGIKSFGRISKEKANGAYVDPKLDQVIDNQNKETKDSKLKHDGLFGEGSKAREEQEEDMLEALGGGLTDFDLSQADPEVNLESGELRVVLRQITKSGNPITFICDFEDFYEDELLVNTPKDSLVEGTNVEASIVLIYNQKKIKVRCEGIIDLVEPFDERRDALSIKIEQIDSKLYQNFMSLYENRQESINDFMNKAKGY